MKQEAGHREALQKASEEWRRRGNVGRALFNATRKFEQDLLASLAGNGFGEIRAVHLNLYRNLDFDGTRLTELAARASMTKQGMQELVDRAEAAGFVERRRPAGWPRQGHCFHGDRGLVLLEALRGAITQAEHTMIAGIGGAQVDLIGQWLRAYTDDSEKSRGAAPTGDD